MSVRIGASSWAASFRIRQGMLWGPVALFALMLLRSFWMLLLFTWMLPIGGKLGPYGVGLAEDFLVKTDVNWLFRISALDWTSVNNFPWDFSSATPMFSLYLEWMNFQKGFGVCFLEGWFYDVVHIVWSGFPHLLCNLFLAGLVPWPCFV